MARPRSGTVISPSTPAIGNMPMDNAYRAMAVRGSASLFAAIVKYHIGQGRNEWRVFQ